MTDCADSGVGLVPAMGWFQIPALCVIHQTMGYIVKFHETWSSVWDCVSFKQRGTNQKEKKPKIKRVLSDDSEDDYKLPKKSKNKV